MLTEASVESGSILQALVARVEAAVLALRADDAFRPVHFLVPNHVRGTALCRLLKVRSCQTLMQNSELQTVIQRLYFDEARLRIKRGAGGKGAGTPRRLMDYLRQIEMNYDLGSIKAEVFWEMLPKEFEKFQRGSMTTGDA
ncbi:MAG: hypothetical protein AB7I50_15970 [Vicinamibacterales bacterium]